MHQQKKINQQIKWQEKHVNDAMLKSKKISLNEKCYLYQVKPFRITTASTFLPPHMTLL